MKPHHFAKAALAFCAAVAFAVSATAISADAPAEVSDLGMNPDMSLLDVDFVSQ